MYRIQIRQQFTDNKVFYGPPVNNLLEVHDLLAILEAAWRTWQARGSPQLPPNDPIQFIEGSEIYVISDEGVTYWLNADGGFEIMN
jgi:hypothetical protein